MRKNFRSLLHGCRIFAIKASNALCGLIKRDNNMVLFTAWFGKKYIDSSRYMFEYCLNNTKFHVFWYATNKNLFLELKNKGLPVVYSRSLKGMFIHAKSRILVSSVQLSDFNPFLLKNSIFLDLGHGFPIKQGGFEQPEVTERFKHYTLMLRKYVKYYMSDSSGWLKSITTRSFQLSNDQIVFCNKPRTDVLFDANLRVGKNDVVDKLKAGRKAIVYMPTQRSLGRVKMPMDQLLDLPVIQSICEEKNCVFLIKKHFYHRNEKENLNQYGNIFDITQEDIDPEVLTFQADVMISDYSAAYIDYLLLDRPVIFYAYDLENYLQNERNLYLKFEDNHAGYKPMTKEDLNAALKTVCSDWIDGEHKEGRLEIRRKYFDDDVPVGNAREEIVKVMHQLISGTYKSKWSL